MAKRNPKVLAMENPGSFGVPTMSPFPHGTPPSTGIANPRRSGQAGTAAGRYYVEVSGKWVASGDHQDAMIDEALSFASDQPYGRTVTVWENLYPGRRKVVSYMGGSRALANPAFGTGLVSMLVLGLVAYGWWERRGR